MNNLTPALSLSQTDRDDLLNKLQRFPLFEGWTPQMLRVLLRDTLVAEFSQDEAVVAAGDLPSNLFILLQGEATEVGGQTTISGDHHDFSWWERALHPGDPFGHQSLLYQQPQPCTVTISTKPRDGGPNVLFITPKGVADMLELHPPELWRERLLAEKRAARLRGFPALTPIPDMDLLYLAPLVETVAISKGEELPSPAHIETEKALLLIDQGRMAIQEEHTGIQGKKRPPDYYLSAGQAFVLNDLSFGGTSFEKPFKAVRAEAETDVRLFTIPFSLLERLHNKLPTGKGFESSLEKVDIAAEISNVPGLELEGVSPEFLKRLAGYMGLEHTPQWYVLTRQGEIGNKLYILRYGEAIIRATDNQGRERPRSYMMVDKPLHPRYFGLRSLLVTGLRDSSIEVTKDAEWFSLAHEDFIQMGRDLTGKLADEFSEWEKRLQERRGVTKTTDGKKPSLWERLKKFIAGPYSEERCYESISLIPGELPERCTRKHIIVLAYRLFLTLFVWFSLASGFFLMMYVVTAKMNRTLSSTTITIVAVIFSVLTLLLIFAQWRDYANDYLVITDKRVVSIDQMLLIGTFPIRERYQETSLDMVQDVLVSIPNAAARALDYGRLTIESAATGGDIVFSQAPEVNELRGEILALISRAKRRTYAARKEQLRKTVEERVAPRLIPEFPVTSIPHRADGAAAGGNPWIELPGWLKNAMTWTSKHILTNPPLKYLVALFSNPSEGKGDKRNRQRALGILTMRWEEGDRIVWRTHWIRLIQETFLPLLAIFIITIILGYLLKYKIWIAAGITLLLDLLVATWGWIEYKDWANDMYALDKSNLYDINKGKFSISLDEKITPFDKIQNVEVEIKSWEAKLLGYGTIIVRTAAEKGVSPYEYIYDPYGVKTMISRRMEEHEMAVEERRSKEDQRRLLAALEVYEETRRKGPPTPPRVWHTD